MTPTPMLITALLFFKKTKGNAALREVFISPILPEMGEKKDSEKRFSRMEGAQNQLFWAK